MQLAILHSPAAPGLPRTAAGEILQDVDIT